jgi:hypothetical protein
MSATRSIVESLALHMLAILPFCALQHHVRESSRALAESALEFLAKSKEGSV